MLERITNALRAIFFHVCRCGFSQGLKSLYNTLVNMIIEYRLNLDQGKDQAQLTWPLPLTSARNRASDVNSSSL